MHKKIISVFLAAILCMLSVSPALAEETELINVALEKQVSVTTGIVGGDAGNLVDGTENWTEVLWDLEHTGVGYIVDLEKLYHIKEFKIHALPTNPSGRDQIWLDCSTDGVSWTNLLARNNDVTDEFSSTVKTSNILTVEAPENSYFRYVRLTSWTYTVWTELEVFAVMPEMTGAVGLGREITVGFSEEISTATVTSESLKLYDGDTLITDYSVKTEGKTVILSLEGNYVGKELTLVVADTVESVCGDRLKEGKTVNITVLEPFEVTELELLHGKTTTTATMAVKNNSADDKTVTLFVAHFTSEGKLEGIKASAKPIAANTAENFEVVYTSEAGFSESSQLKAFVWDTTGGAAIPIAPPETRSGKITSVYVAINGNDENDGSRNAPFATIERAMEEIRCYNSDMTEDLTVYIGEGVYELENTLTFTNEDGGTNGYDVIYKAAEGDGVVISGGRAVKGWTEGEKGIWYAPVDGITSALSMSVDGKAARRAESEEWIDITSIFPDERDIDTESGITVADVKYAQYKNPSDIQLKFIRGWKSYLLNVDRIIADDSGSKFIMRQPTFYFAEYNKADSMGYETQFYNIAENNNFLLENAFEELDTPGEFYYDRSEKLVYYMPREGENPLTGDIRISKLEKLVEICGSNSASKVNNLAFEGLTFADAAWNRAAEYGFVSDQAQTLIYDPKVPAENPGYTMTPANISVKNAQAIRFENNVLRNMNAVGIGFYDGVDNSVIRGNVFADIGDSAVTVGNPEQVYEEEVYYGYNIAAGKTASAGSILTEHYTPNRALDTNTKTLWAPQDYQPSWWQIDLEQEYEIDRIELDFRADGVNQSFDDILMYASNDSSFETYAELDVTAATTDTGMSYTVLDSNKYRYVRLKHRIDNAHWVLAEIRIINESMNYVPSTDICENNLISNNYITRTGAVNTAAPGMQLYYVRNTEISNNLICEVPYSGIALGWGWTMYPDSVTCGNNSIKNNKLEKVMQLGFDGGGIYLSGQQQGNAQISGNHIKTAVNGSGIYLDNGSSNCTITNNVVEDVIEDFCAGMNTGPNVWSDNYSASTLYSIYHFNEEGKNTFEIPNYFIYENYPQEAAAIAENAGLTPEYAGIVAKAGENLQIWTAEDYYNNMKNDEDNEHITAGDIILRYNTSFTDTVSKWIELAKAEGKYDEASSEMVEMTSAAEAAKEITTGSDRSLIFDACIRLREAMYNFAESIKQ